MTVRVYKSTDAGAPVLTGQFGTLITLLDACLVTGYGGNTPAGWTKPYSGTDKAVFKPQGDNGYYRFDDSAARGGGYTGQTASAKAFESMTDVDTGVDQFPAVSDTQRFVFKSSSKDDTARKWIIIADEFGFYLYLETHQTSIAYRLLTYFGRYNPHNLSDAWTFGFHATHYEYLAYSSFHSTSVGTDAHCLARSFDGTVKSVKAGNANRGIFFDQIVMRNATDIMLSSTEGMWDSANSGMVRCYLPGLYTSRNDQQSIQLYNETGQVLDGPNGAGSLYILCPPASESSSYRGMVAIDTVNWNR